MGEMEQNIDLLTSSSLNYSVVLIRRVYVPVTGAIRVNKKSEDPILKKHMFRGEKTQ